MFAEVGVLRDADEQDHQPDHDGGLCRARQETADAFQPEGNGKREWPARVQ